MGIKVLITFLCIRNISLILEQLASVFIISTFLLLLSSCKEDPPVGPPVDIPKRDTVTISVHQITHRSVSLNIKTTFHNPNRIIKLYRDYSQVAQYPAYISDTVITDDNNGMGLLLNTTYTWYAVSSDSTGSVKDSSNKITTGTLDTTSHDYTWEEFTFGYDAFGHGSYFSDVWGLDDNNVWACGTVFLDDTTVYGVFKWDGIEWKPIKKNGGIDGIYGFSANDIWAVGGGVYHFDGTEWKQMDHYVVNGQFTVLDSVLFKNRPYTAVWGTSSSDIYLASHWGTVIRWDGKKGSVVYSNNISLSDLYGYSSSFILACGSTLAPPSTALIYNGSKWEEIVALDKQRLLYSMYMVNPEEYYAVGEQVQRYRNGVWSKVIEGNPVMNIIRGNKETGELAAAGYFNVLYHYNGNNWMKYQFRQGYFTLIQGVFLTRKKLFAVGSVNEEATILIGTHQ